MISDAVTLTLQIVVTGKPFVEESGHITGFLLFDCLISPPFWTAEQRISYIPNTIIPLSSARVSRVWKVYIFSFSAFINRRRTLPKVSGLSSLKTDSTTNDLLPKR